MKTKDDVDFIVSTVERFAAREIAARRETIEARHACSRATIESVAAEKDAALQRAYKVEALDALRALVLALDVILIARPHGLEPIAKPEMDRAREVLARHEGGK